MSHPIRFCPDCGSHCEEQTPEDDHRPRSVCTSCGLIHYVNPKIVAGCVVEHEGQLLLCRRDIEPARGRWTFPAGYLECGESCAEGAARETLEESEAEVEVTSLLAILDIPHISQVYVVYRARLVGEHFATTPESSEVRLFDVDDIPWAELAFPSVKTSLELWCADLRADEVHRSHGGTVEWSREGSRFDLAQYRLTGHRHSGTARFSL